MSLRSITASLLIAALAPVLSAADAPPFRFSHHFIDADAPVPTGTIGFAMTALADFDGDGDLDFLVGHRGGGDLLYWYEHRSAQEWVRHLVGSEHQSDVGAVVLDVDRDGRLDVVTSGVWFRNPRDPRNEPFERRIFDAKASGGHDALATDIDGDGHKDIVLMGDLRSALKELCWYRIPADPTQPWPRFSISSPVHGAITPAGALDIDGDGDVDLVRADTWLENPKDPTQPWTSHRNLPVGRTGPYGMCVRAAAADLDGDGRLELVVLDADVVPCGAYIVRNADGRGGTWTKTTLPQSFAYGSLHSLAVADLDGDGDLDIVTNEQEDMLPSGRTDPRWIAWENDGRGGFKEHVILDRRLGGHELVVGDVDGDGDMDICSKPWRTKDWNSAGGKLHLDYLENQSRPSTRRTSSPSAAK